MSYLEEKKKELEKIEKSAGISNPEDFRQEIVNFSLRHRAKNDGKNPKWTSYEKLRTVIEQNLFSNTEDLLPVISFNAKGSEDDVKKTFDACRDFIDKTKKEEEVDGGAAQVAETA